jgi:adenylylsulfate kinase
MSGVIVWFTGLPASGKTTLAQNVRHRLGQLARPAILLDSDELREVLGTADYDTAGRDEFYLRLGRLALLLATQGHVVLVSATAPRRQYRDDVRVQAPRFVEVWVSTPLAECASRDPKGLYARAAAGEAPRLPGLGTPYDPPLQPEVVARGGYDEAAVQHIVARIWERLAA